MIGWPVMLMGAIPRLFMAVAQALGSEMGIAKELDSMAIFRSPSERERDIETFMDLYLEVLVFSKQPKVQI